MIIRTGDLVGVDSVIVWRYDPDIPVKRMVLPSNRVTLPNMPPSLGIFISYVESMALVFTDGQLIVVFANNIEPVE